MARRKNLTDSEEDRLRLKDLAMLRFVVDRGNELLSEVELRSAASIQDSLEDKNRRYETMSDPQRRLLIVLCRKIDPTGEEWDERDDGLTPAERMKCQRVYLVLWRNKRDEEWASDGEWWFTRRSANDQAATLREGDLVSKVVPIDVPADVFAAPERKAGRR